MADPTARTTSRHRAEDLGDALAQAAPGAARAGRRPGGPVPQRRLVGCDADRARSRRRTVHPQADLARGGLDRARDARHRPARGLHRRHGIAPGRAARRAVPGCRQRRSVDRDADARPVERAHRLGATRARSGRRSGDARPRHRGGRRAPRHALGRLPPDQSGLGLAVVSAARAPVAADAAVGRALPRRGPGRRRSVRWPAGTPSSGRPRWRRSA